MTFFDWFILKRKYKSEYLLTNEITRFLRSQSSTSPASTLLDITVCKEPYDCTSGTVSAEPQQPTRAIFDIEKSSRETNPGFTSASENKFAL